MTRQSVSKAFNVIDSKVSKSLLEAAQLNRIEISKVNRERGFLLGRSPALGMDALITFSDVNGLQLWFRGEGNCSECDLADQCKAALVREAKFRGIELPENFDEVQPTLIADMLFEVIMRD